MTSCHDEKYQCHFILYIISNTGRTQFRWLCIIPVHDDLPGQSPASYTGRSVGISTDPGSWYRHIYQRTEMENQVVEDVDFIQSTVSA